MLQTFIRPHPRITDLRDQRNARLLMIMLPAVLVIGITTLVFQGLIRTNIYDDPDVQIIMAALGLVLVAYIVTLIGRPRGGAALVIIALLAASGFAPFVEGAEPQLLATTIIPVLLTAFFFQPRWIVAIIVLQSITVFTQIALSPFVEQASYALLYQILLLADVLILVFINHMQGIERERRARLEAANNALRQSEMLLERRVEERTEELKVARDEAIAAREQAEEADRIKSQFLASMSHELRTPLNAILNFTEMTALGMVGPVNEQQVDVMNKSLDSGKHLLSLINDVLDITKIQSGMLTLFVEDNIDLNHEVASVATTTHSLLQDRPVRLVLDIDQQLPIIRGDRRRIRQILLNLVSNAVKFTEEGTITLSAKSRGGEVLFAVADTGPGIAEEDISLIFEPFIQTESGVKHAGGTGLGLPISRRLAEAHGGKLWVESQPGEGTTFFVTLPLQAMYIGNGNNSHENR